MFSEAEMRTTESRNETEAMVSSKKETRDTLESHQAVGAIDFGTSYSGYAFSLTCKKKDIVLKRWMSGHTGLITEKTPTCILFDRDENFKAFGYEAENAYATYSSEGHSKDYYFFRNYKMALYNKLVVDMGLKVKDFIGREFPLLTVISETLKHLRLQMIQHIKDQTGVELSMEKDILFVLTVPAIWSDSAKAFMRAAAETAGIPTDQLLISLEPEAAAVFCQSIPFMSQNSRTDLGKFIHNFLPGNKYIVVDAGGGTVDIVAHKVECDGNLNEIHPASGGDGGGSEVDEEFLKYMKYAQGSENFEELKHTNIEDYLYLIREFEAKKRSFQDQRDENEKVQIRIPMIIHSETNPRSFASDSCFDPPEFSARQDKIRINNKTFNQFFEASKHKIQQYVSRLLEKDILTDVHCIILVGGYANSEILKRYMKETFDYKTVITPHHAETAVMRGAVTFGHDPSVIAERRCRYTYGIAISKCFDESQHKESTKFTDDFGNVLARDCFAVHAHIGQNVKTGVFQPAETYNPIVISQSHMGFPLYVSSKCNPIYIHETECEQIGNVLVDISNLKGNNEDKAVCVALCFSETEIIVKATTEQTGKEVSSKVVYDWHM